MAPKPLLNFDYRKAMAPVLGPRAAMAKFEEVLVCARNESVASIKKLVEFRDNEQVPVAIRVACCGMILDRAWGKPHQSIAVQEVAAPLPVDFNALDEEELLELERMLKKAGKAGEELDRHPIIDVESVDVTDTPPAPPVTESVNVAPARVPSRRSPPPEPTVVHRPPGKILG